MPGRNLVGGGTLRTTRPQRALPIRDAIFPNGTTRRCADGQSAASLAANRRVRYGAGRLHTRAPADRRSAPRLGHHQARPTLLMVAPQRGAAAPVQHTPCGSLAAAVRTAGPDRFSASTENRL